MADDLAEPATASPETPPPGDGYRRLAWAGVELRWGSHRVLIDPLEDTDRLVGFLGRPRDPVERAAPPPGMTTDVLLTHAHPDHFDPVAIARQLQGGGRVWASPAVAPAVADAGLPVHPVSLGATYHMGPFQATPVAASDGFGDEQVSWVVGSAARRVVHAGDTLWHGHWWATARAHGPFEVAFLPINGFVGQLPGMTPTTVPSTMTPQQAVEAAHVLGARAVCPIHYGLFDNPPVYVESPDPLAALQQAAAGRHLTVAPPAGALHWAA